MSQSQFTFEVCMRFLKEMGYEAEKKHEPKPIKDKVELRAWLDNMRKAGVATTYHFYDAEYYVFISKKEKDRG